MRKTTTKVVCAVLASAAAFAMTSALPGATSTALAGDKSARSLGAPVAASSHRSVLAVNDRDLPMTKGLTVARNKSLLIELPRELRDVVVSDPTVLDVVVQSSNRAYLIGKTFGQANAFFFDVHGERVLTLEIQVERDTAVLDALYHRLMAGSNIRTEVVNDTLILTGTVRNPADSNKAVEIARRFAVADPKGDVTNPVKVINMLAVDGEEQVQLRVTVAEVQRSILKQFGVNLGAFVNSGNFSTTVLSENALPVTAAAGLGNLPVPAVDLANNALRLFNQGPGANTFGNSGVAGAWTSGGNRISHAIRALERNGLVRTLAEPNLTAVSGETAKFLAGGEYPVPVVNSDGALSVSFKEFGVGLAFTPIVMSEGRISLKIEVEVSELTTAGAVSLSNISIPALKKRQTKSTVELPSGGSIALAGLMSTDTRQNIDGMPGLKDLPVLGTLFRSRDFIKEETELVVIVTPYMVRPVARQKLARPLDGLASATDMKANFLGHLNRIYGKGSTLTSGSTKDVGFIVE